MNLFKRLKNIEPQWIIALVAIFGFVLSVYTSYKTSENFKIFQDASIKMVGALDKMEDNAHKLSKSLTILAKPVITWQTINFDENPNKKEPLSCKNPPIGFTVTIQNLSIVAAEIRDIDIKIYLDTMEINEPYKEYKNYVFILPSGYQHKIKSRPDEFQRHLARIKELDEHPFLRILLSVEYAIIGEKFGLKYSVEKQIKYDCRKGFACPIETVREYYNEISFTK